LLQTKKRPVNNYLIAAKEKTTWNTRREFSDEGGGDEDNRANPRQFPAKTNGDKGKPKK
jgi:hypothetical protein